VTRKNRLLLNERLSDLHRRVQSLKVFDIGRIETNLAKNMGKRGAAHSCHLQGQWTNTSIRSRGTSSPCLPSFEYILAPSPSSCTAYVQLPLAFMSSIDENLSHIMFVVAVHVLPNCERATTPTFDRVSCRGSTHCCWAHSRMRDDRPCGP
jgi:hypothetical protein